jgi:hypothetical protein
MPRKSAKPHVTESGKEIPSGIARIAFAQELRLSGARFVQAQKAIAAKFGVSDRQAAEDIKEAARLIAEANERDLPLDIERVKAELWNTVAMLDHAATAALDDHGDVKAHVSAIGARTQPLARLASILGMDAPTKIRVEGGITDEQKRLLDALSMTPAQRSKRMKELESGGHGTGV